MNCPILCIFCQTASDFPLNRRCDQTLVAVLHHFSKNRCCDRIFSYKHLPLDPSKNLFFRCIHLYCEDFFLLTTVRCKDTMSRKLLDRLLEFIIHLIYIFHCLHTLFSRNKSLCFLLQRFLCHLKHDDICQRLQSFFLRNNCSCTSLRTIRTVKILYYHKSLCIQNLFFQLRCQFALFFNTCKNLFLFVFQISQVKKSFMQ